MNKREIIREGIAKRVWNIDRPDSLPTWEELKKDTHEQCQMEVKNHLIDADYLLEYLHSQGVVIKVDKELPKR